MMFIVRSSGAAPPAGAVEVKLVRKAPDTVPDGPGKNDFFCLGDEAAMAALREQGCEIVALRDGWYADGRGGGVAIFGHGKYWEIRDTPFTVAEACGPAGSAEGVNKDGEHVEVRRAIFGV